MANEAEETQERVYMKGRVDDNGNLRITDDSVLGQCLANDERMCEMRTLLIRISPDLKHLVDDDPLRFNTGFDYITLQVSRINDEHWFTGFPQKMKDYHEEVELCENAQKEYFVLKKA